MTPLQPLPLPERAAFSDLVFRPHPDGIGGHTQALHVIGKGVISVTRGGQNFGTNEAPYEVMAPNGEIHAPLTAEMVTDLLRSFPAVK